MKRWRLKTVGRVLSAFLLAALAADVDASPIQLIKDVKKLKAYYKELGKGELAAAVGKWDDSRTAYRRAITIATEPMAAHQGYQDAMERLARDKDVWEQYRDKLRRQPKNARAHYLLARLTADTKEKERLLIEAAKLDPKLYWAHYALGHLYEHQEKWEAGEKAFKRVIELRPLWDEGRHSLGFCYLQQGKNDQAEAVFKKVLARNARFVDSLVNMGVIAMRRKKYDQVIAWSKKALAIDKTNPGAFNNQGKAYYHQGRLREALKSYKAALVSKEVQRPEVIFLNMGFCYYRMRQWAQAAAAYERATSINKDFAYAYYCLAQARFRQETYPAAWKSVHQAQARGYKVHERFLKMLRKAAPEPKKP